MAITVAILKFKVESELREDTSDFFHLDAELHHKAIYDFQILSYDKESKKCVVEIYLHNAVEESKLEHLLDGHRLSVSVNCREVAYSDVTLSV